MPKQSSLFKRIFSALISSAVIISCIPTVSAAKSETADAAVSAMTAGWNLGNTLDSCGEWIGLYTKGLPSDYETAWGNPVTQKKMITAVKKAGFNSVRVPVTWSEHIDDKGNIDKKWLDRVQETVDYVISQDMYCILNVHHDAGSDGWLEASEECYKKSSGKFAGLWNNIAVRFKNYDDKLIFESFNEILDKHNSWTDAKDNNAYDAVNDFNQLFVDTVRKTGGNNSDRNLMLQVYSGSCSEKTLNNFTLPADSVKNHLIVQVHNYDPQGFTAAEVSWAKMTDQWGSAADKSAFDKLFARLGKYSEQLDVPFVVGEFGAEYKDNDSERAEYAEYFVSKAAEYGIKCFWWDVGNMAVIDRKACKVSHPQVADALTADYGKKTSAKADDTETGKQYTTKAVSGKSKVKLTWTACDDADAYRIYQYDKKTGKFLRIATVKGTSYTVKNLKKGSYKFKISAASKTKSGYKNILLYDSVTAKAN